METKSFFLYSIKHKRFSSVSVTSLSEHEDWRRTALPTQKTSGSVSVLLATEMPLMTLGRPSQTDDLKMIPVAGRGTNSALNLGEEARRAERRLSPVCLALINISTHDFFLFLVPEIITVSQGSPFFFSLMAALHHGNMNFQQAVFYRGVSISSMKLKKGLKSSPTILYATLTARCSEFYPGLCHQAVHSTAE